LRTSGIAASRLKAATVKVAATIQVALRIRNLHQPAAGMPEACCGCVAAERDDTLEANAEIFWRFLRNGIIAPVLPGYFGILENWTADKKRK
jgi:hypothetical protein